MHLGKQKQGQESWRCLIQHWPGNQLLPEDDMDYTAYDGAPRFRNKPGAELVNSFKLLYLMLAKLVVFFPFLLRKFGVWRVIWGQSFDVPSGEAALREAELQCSVWTELSVTMFPSVHPITEHWRPFSKLRPGPVNMISHVICVCLSSPAGATHV